ncbi:hypothetical protein C8F04DRAFT_1253792 [Mycena alexandri]|uniref:Uncharacterized protein n=1 Tax=Mycena alexandri TaxID=1745969 RepID=A0AAD6T668_9AGAR|nr:hypothetical protein C8F04DRAFT_1253792 [Mycena alexandri]
MSKVLSAQILERLLAHPSLAGNLTFYKVQRFFELTTRLWLEIVPPSTARPDFLPDNIANLLSIVLQLEPVKRVLGKQTKMLPNAKDDEQNASQAKPNPKNGYTN